MKWKRKYLLIPVIILIIIKSCISITSGSYTKEVYTAYSTSPGFVFETDTVFLTSYRLYKKPAGLRRFPDGGQTKRVFEAVYLIKIPEGKKLSSHKIPDVNLSDTEIRHIRAREISGNLILYTVKTASGESYQINSSKRKIKAVKTAADEGGINLESLISNTETKKIFKDQIDNLKLPSPLDYSRTPERQQIEDVVRQKGDFFYRKAVIDNLKKSSLEDLLEKMESYEESLKKEKPEYSIYSEETKKYIKARIEL